MSMRTSPIEITDQLALQVERSCDARDFGAALSMVQQFVEKVIFNPASVAKVFVSGELDAICKTIASQKLELVDARCVDARGTVILVSELSMAGGHNELIKDIVRLKLFPDPVVVVQTDCFERLDKEVLMAFTASAGIETVQPIGNDLNEKFSWLLDFLQRETPRKFLVLSHNQDALAISVAFAAKAMSTSTDVIYIHHGDHHLSLGAATQDFIHVDPHNIGYFHCRNELGNRDNHYWPLTATIPEAIERKKIFLESGSLITCSSGRAEKFEVGSYAFDYFKILPQVLRATGGVHVHIGDLESGQLEKIGIELISVGVDPSKFLHIPWVQSVAQALVDYSVDLYISSFPLGGGKASLEAMAAGVPLLMHESYRSRFHGGVDIAYPEAFVWRNPAELLSIVSAMDAGLLAFHSRKARLHYETFHSQHVLMDACNFANPQDESIIPPLRKFRADDLACFLDEHRSQSRLVSEISRRDAELVQLSEDMVRLQDVVTVKDEHLAQVGSEVHRLEAMIQSKDERLREIGLALENANTRLSEQSGQLTQTDEKLRAFELLKKSRDNDVHSLEQQLTEARHIHAVTEVQYQELIGKVTQLEESVKSKQARLNFLESQVDDVLQQLTLKSETIAGLTADIDRKTSDVETLKVRCTQMTEDLTRQKETISELSLLPARLHELEAELVALTGHTQDQCNYFYAEVAKRDKLLGEAALRNENLRKELEEKATALRLFKETRLFRLRQILLFHPFGFRKLVLVLATVGGGLVPRRWRADVVPRLQRLFNLKPATPLETTSAPSAYQVKQPAEAPSNAPRVVHAIANFMTGGSSRLVIDIVEYLGHEYRQSVLTSFNPDPPAYEGIEIEEFRSPADMAPFVDYFERMRPDLVHMHYWGDCDEPWYAKVMDAAQHLGIPVIENINTPVDPYLSDAVVRYVYVSDYVRSVFGQPKAHHVTVYPGSDFGLFTRAREESAPNDCVGMVYRLEHDKLNEDAIQPFIHIAKQRPSTRILIVGGGSLLEPFQNAVNSAGVSQCFEFTGYVPYSALPDLYRRMSMFVAPIWKESFGQVAPFAMSMKVPVVGYDVGAIGEIIGDRELLAPAADAEALAKIVVDLLNAPDRRRQLGETQQQRAQARFSIQAMISHYSDIYNEISRITRKEYP